ncbi:MAG: nicotinate-nucleotide adenylyltransferase [Eubacterium sp.]|nr:nicotinate-nucleotide adenylyltransferase [Eubacterium sp.]
MKKAILGGSFNPIHNGHLMMARCAYEQFGLEDIVVMPNKTTYYKENRVFASDEHRLNMIRLAIEGKDYLSISDMEIKRGGVTHTIDTVREYKSIYPDIELYFIVGGDSLEWIDRWVDADELLDSMTILSAVRGKTDITRSKDIIKRIKNEHPRSHIELLNMEHCAISSSDIREKIARGEDVKGMLPDSVYRYIKENNLYNGEVDS